MRCVQVWSRGAADILAVLVESALKQFLRHPVGTEGVDGRDADPPRDCSIQYSWIVCP